MLKSEFIERTGWEPTNEEYEKIEEEYYNYPGNKDDFCADFVISGRTTYYARQRTKKIDALKAEVQESRAEVARLQALLKDLERLSAENDALLQQANDDFIRMAELTTTARRGLWARRRT